MCYGYFLSYNHPALMRKSKSKRKIGAPLTAPIKPPKVTISQVVKAAAEKYLADPDTGDRSDLYELVLQEIEPALLSAVLEHTDNNQSETAIILGLNRGTLRKKLGKYGFL